MGGSPIMKILFDHQLPFALAHGGLQIQIEQTKGALEASGLEVEYLRFWDERQSGDVIHFFGRCSGGYIELAHQKGLAVVMSDLLTGAGSRSKTQLQSQKALIRLAKILLPKTFTSKMGWESYHLADAVIALTPWEAHLMVDLFQADQTKLHIVTNGVDDCFFLNDEPLDRQEWLICTATITERKRVVELAEAAIKAGVKLRVIGRPYSESDPYYQRFLSICRAHSDLVDFTGPILDRSRLSHYYQQARGFVLLSTMESLSLSALEAAAAGCPLLLSDLPWARTTFGQNAAYCSVQASRDKTAAILKLFSDSCGDKRTSLKPLRWLEVGRQLVRIYDEVKRSTPASLVKQLEKLS
jgi:glycosyltransferase involved in cell wall biosynthesis